MPSGERRPLTAQPVLFGRSPECTIVINDTNVSRRHCEIKPIAAGFVISDLGSTNGTKINASRIDGERLLHRLLHPVERNDDVLGNTETFPIRKTRRTK